MSILSLLGGVELGQETSAAVVGSGDDVRIAFLRSSGAWIALNDDENALEDVTVHVAKVRSIYRALRRLDAVEAGDVLVAPGNPIQIIFATGVAVGNRITGIDLDGQMVELNALLTYDIPAAAA